MSASLFDISQRAPQPHKKVHMHTSKRTHVAPYAPHQGAGAHTRLAFGVRTKEAQEHLNAADVLATPNQVLLDQTKCLCARCVRENACMLSRFDGDICMCV